MNLGSKIIRLIISLVLLVVLWAVMIAFPMALPRWMYLAGIVLALVDLVKAFFGLFKSHDVQSDDS